MQPIYLILPILLLIAIPVSAQEVTQEPLIDDYMFAFPLPTPDIKQVEEARSCLIGGDDGNQATLVPDSACDIAAMVAHQAQLREQAAPTQNEIDDFEQLINANPAMILHLPIIAGFYNQVALVAPPSITQQQITTVHLRYTFSGLGNSLDYDVTITHADRIPQVSGDIQNDDNMDFTSSEETQTPEALTLRSTVDADFVQALAPALSDLIPIGTQFSNTPCWDYYPDWTVVLTFADGTVLEMVTNDSNVVGIGGPWQVEIDGQVYMQYSAAFSNTIVDLLDALQLPLGQTAAMGCGGIVDPLESAWPQEP